MECSSAVMRILSSIVVVVLLAMPAPPAYGEEQVVLVASAESPIDNLSSLELRKAYLGISVRRDGDSIRALRNMTDPQLNRIFLQSVMATSQPVYERRLLSLALKYGRPRPAEYDNHAAILRALTEHPYSITYMWKTDADQSPNLKVIKVLWREN